VAKGVFATCFANILFAVLFYYATLLEPLTGEEVFGWRMVLNAPVITLMVVLTGDWRLVGATIERARRSPALAFGLVACAMLLAAQIFVFVWGPVNGLALEVSLGFFLMPLTLVLIGRVAFGERLTSPQVVATILAAGGVGNEVFRAGSVSWVTAVVAIGYPLYFAVRRSLRTDHQGGVWIKMHLILPVAVAAIVAGPNGIGVVAERPALFWLIPGLGLISALGLSANLYASRVLPFVVFGLLVYLEPVLLVFVALLLGERIEPGQWLTYIPIWIALAVLFGEGVRRLGPWRSLLRRRQTQAA
jgi:chloramphenicol-sensitive protein RarD